MLVLRHFLDWMIFAKMLSRQVIMHICFKENIRMQRLKASRHYTDEKITDMIASQPSEDTFRQACQAVIDNSGDFEDTKRQIGDKL